MRTESASSPPSLEAARGDRRGCPQGETSERSRWVTDRKQVGNMKRSRMLPRRVREVLVARSRTSHFRQTSAAAFRLRTSETAAIMLERITSGRSFMMVGLAKVAIEEGRKKLVDE